ncbi:hypothetical protein [Pseudobacter ginsenosidimutans]|uniref:Adhesin domain-containing protein n=1 Tax=Pseudobacter ginsenosidimutans TaxID=661488 RepID=A0A4Q7MFV4_9BACT|nr:hypothetical protein [Pseudobacter ginsenosidimutans]QEC45530.1 hypothetical protein FSB84_28970 [Pseudobacter ginsenosidimutans]RZS67066.1 hypothetical protein EV199_5451 [Pseudobacter ginsenosidimutans]
MSKVYNALLLVLSFAFTGTAIASENPLVEKKKVYTKSYPLSGNDKVSLTNKFGSLKINTWTKNEVKVEVTISAEAKTEERAQSILDGITINDSKNSEGVIFKTSIKGNNNQRWEKGEKQGFQVDYEVFLPAQNPLYAANEFGPLVIGDHSGEATVISKFGSARIGKLGNAKKIQVEFGSLILDAMNNGNLVIKFSSVEVRKTSGELNIDVEHSSAKLNLDNAVKNVTVKNSFSPLLLDVPANFSATYNIRTSFAKFKNKTSFAINKEDEDESRGPKFDFDYTGKSGGGETSVKVKTSFGDITIGHNLPFKVEEKNKKTKDI